jgi:hypothetical protein
MTTTLNGTAIALPSALWTSLQKDAGLELRMSTGKPGRDADLEIEIIDALALQFGAPRRARLSDMLLQDEQSAAPQIGIEKFLEAVLATQRGFAAMMKDILDTLVKAQATESSSALSVSFKFDDVTPAFRLTLEQFRATTERVVQLAVRRRELPHIDTCRALLGALRNLKDGKPDAFTPHIPAPPPSPTSGHAELDGIFSDITEVLDEYRRWCMQFGSTRGDIYQTVRQRISNDTPANQNARDLAVSATDYWDLFTTAAMHASAREVKAGRIPQERAVASLRPIVDEIPTREKWIQQTYKALLDLLNLPVWEKRYELYSVWVGTCLLGTALKQQPLLRFHLVNGELSFAFGGSHLASYSRDGVDHQIWAERQSALLAPSTKRTKAIQPDFRVMHAANTDEDIGPNTRFVLECKHYQRSSASNFRQAAIDYASSCVNAAVLVVNHGPADHEALSVGLGTLDQHISFLGGVSADKPGAKRELEEAIKEVLFPVGEGTGPGELDAGPGTISLHWDASLGDLDLAIELYDMAGVKQDTVNFSDRGRLDAAPFACLRDDVRRGPGAEIIDISRWCAPRYEVVVTKYSGEGELKHGHLHCEVAAGGVVTTIEYPLPGVGALRWHAATIEHDWETSRIGIIKR